LYNSPANIAILLGLIFNILKNHPKALLLLIRKRKSYETNKLKCESKFLSIKRSREELNENKENLPEEDEYKENNEEEYNILNKIENDNENTENLFCKYDQFKDEEIDPYKTNAQNSCLWELYSLKNHYNFKIRSLVNKFERNFLKTKEFDISSISDLKDNDLLYEANDKANFYFNTNSKRDEIKENINKKFIDLFN
jgi:hypothetical protein